MRYLISFLIDKNNLRRSLIWKKYFFVFFFVDLRSLTCLEFVYLDKIQLQLKATKLYIYKNIYAPIKNKKRYFYFLLLFYNLLLLLQSWDGRLKIGMRQNWKFWNCCRKSDWSKFKCVFLKTALFSNRVPSLLTNKCIFRTKSFCTLFKKLF